MAPSKSTGDPRDMAVGAFLQCAEAATLGLPFEVWKTQQISNVAKGQWNGCLAELAAVWRDGGAKKFYHGFEAKMYESALKGAILLWGSNLTLEMTPMLGFDRKGAAAGMVAGFVGGVMQTVVMSPMTYVVTFKNRNKEAAALSSYAILKQQGFRAAFGSAPAMAGRQGTNWALRWAFAQGITSRYKQFVGGRKLTAPEEIMCGLAGGACGCINQPFEVLRVVQQARVATGDKTANTRNSAALVYKTHGLSAFYAGIVPRMGLSAWQTLFMVTFAGMIKEQLNAVAAKPIAK